MVNLKKNKNIFVAGHNGMVGRAIVRAIKYKEEYNVITKDRNELDLTNQNLTSEFIREENIDIIINAAAKVGGILANDIYPYDFIMDNLKIQNNLIEAAVKMQITKFIFLGSSCIYPKYAPQPIKEEYLLTGTLEPTNQWYAIAKISGIMACIAAKKQHGLNSVSLMPTNLYGFNDNFDLHTSHVLPAMIRKFHEAKMTDTNVQLWGSGSPFREFLFVDDLASAVELALTKNLIDDIYNVGYGTDISIKDLAELVQDIIGHKGEIIWDKSKPDGTPKKLMDSSKLRSLGWQPNTKIREGIEMTYQWYIKTIKKNISLKGNN